jgi:hypothetical protein
MSVSNFGEKIIASSSRFFDNFFGLNMRKKHTTVETKKKKVELMQQENALSPEAIIQRWKQLKPALKLILH